MINRIEVSILLVLVLCSVFPGCSDKHVERKPNLIVVFPDQLRRQALGFMNEDPVLTPNIDAFAAESMVFTNAISNVPICSPFRAMLLTGRYPHSTGIRTNLLKVQNFGLSADEITLGETLQDHGYQTGYIGKWHLANPAELPPRIDPAQVLAEGKELAGPNRHGFSFSLKSQSMHKNRNNMYWENGKKLIENHGWAIEYETDHAIEFIRSREDDKPFALVISWGPPHAPFDVPEKYLEMYRDKPYQLRPNVDSTKVDPDTYKYFAGVTWCDDNFGRLIAALDEEGLKDNTIVMFTSDHGEMLNSHGDFHEKTYWYEETMGIPCIIRWPGNIKPGWEDLMFSAYDYMPTLLGLMGLDIPQRVEGSDWSSTVLGRGDRKPESAFFAHYPYLAYGVPFEQELKYHTVFEQGKARLANGYGDLSQVGFRGVTTGKYTYVVDKCPLDEPLLSFNWREWMRAEDYDVIYNSPGELIVRELFYDNKRDPYQMSPISMDSQEYLGQIDYMRNELRDWLKTTHDDFTIDDEGASNP